MMKSYTAYCMNEDGENLCMTREYTAKAHFISDLHGNGYKVHFVALTDKYDEESAKYYERLETKRRRAAIRRECERHWRELDKKFAEELEKRLATEETAEEPTAEEPAAEEPAAEEPAQEAKTMKASREFFTLEEKTRKADNHYNIVADSDTEYEVKNAPTSEAAVKLAMEKYAKKLETIGTPAAELLARTVRDYIRFEYFSAANGYNYSGEGGGAFEISVDYLDDTTTAVYLRVAEILEEGEEPEEENQEEEKPAENETDSAFITEMFAALGYFKRVLWSYTAAEGGTRSERDISGDFWGAHECSVILSFVNDRLKAQGAEPHYKLKNDFDDLTECFEEIMQKFEYGDERTIEEIIAEYNFS